MSSRNQTENAAAELVTLDDAITNFSSLVDRAAQGEKFVITKSGRPLARLLPLEPVAGKRVPGQGKGHWRLSEDFNGPLPDSIVSAFELR